MAAHDPDADTPLPAAVPVAVPLETLERDLAAALARAQRTHDATLAQMDGARRTLDALLRDEAAATALYVDDTRLHLRALRDVMQLEMDKARHDVDAFLAEATRNAMEARDTRDRVRSETRAKREALHARRAQQERAWREQVARVKLETQRKAEQFQRERSAALELPEKTRAPAAPQPARLQWIQSAVVERVTAEPVWVLPFVVALLVGACLWVTWSARRARRAAAERRQRVLYSSPLKSRAANASLSSTGNGNTRRRETKQSVEGDSPRSPSGLHHGATTQRRLRPAWSPAASTASTVSPPETPTGVFSSRSAAFESVSPSPF